MAHDYRSTACRERAVSDLTGLGRGAPVPRGRRGIAPPAAVAVRFGDIHRRSDDWLHQDLCRGGPAIAGPVRRCGRYANDPTARAQGCITLGFCTAADP